MGKSVTLSEDEMAKLKELLYGWNVIGAILIGFIVGITSARDGVSKHMILYRAVLQMCAV